MTATPRPRKDTHTVNIRTRLAAALAATVAMTGAILGAAAPASAAPTSTARHYYVSINRCSAKPGHYTTRVVRLRTRPAAVNHAWGIDSRYRALRVVDADSGAVALTLAQYTDGQAC